MNEKIFRDQLQRRIYRLGYLVFGEQSGGAMTTNLLKRKGGLWETMDALIAALGSANPRDYIGGVLRKAVAKMDDEIPEGTRMGMYEKRDGKMVQWIEKYDYDRLPAEEKAKYGAPKKA